MRIIMILTGLVTLASAIAPAIASQVKVDNREKSYKMGTGVITEPSPTRPETPKERKEREDMQDKQTEKTDAQKKKELDEFLMEANKVKAAVIRNGQK